MPHDPGSYRRPIDVDAPPATSMQGHTMSMTIHPWIGSGGCVDEQTRSDLVSSFCDVVELLFDIDGQAYDVAGGGVDFVWGGIDIDARCGDVRVDSGTAAPQLSSRRL
jgi:hypothetical protein